MFTTIDANLESWRIRAAHQAAQGPVCVAEKLHRFEFLGAHARKIRTHKTATRDQVGIAGNQPARRRWFSISSGRFLRNILLLVSRGRI
jgi:hypothetical protein